MKECVVSGRLITNKENWSTSVHSVLGQCGDSDADGSVWIFEMPLKKAPGRAHPHHDGISNQTAGCWAGSVHSRRQAHVHLVVDPSGNIRRIELFLWGYIHLLLRATAVCSWGKMSTEGARISSLTVLGYRVGVCVELSAHVKAQATRTHSEEEEPNSKQVATLARCLKNHRLSVSMLLKIPFIFFFHFKF